MYIENKDTLVVKSSVSFYDKERTGLKPNTYRVIDSIVREKNTFDSIEYIRVQKENNPQCSFKRKVKDVSYWSDMMIVSWEHSDGIN